MSFNLFRRKRKDPRALPLRPTIAVAAPPAEPADNEAGIVWNFDDTSTPTILLQSGRTTALHNFAEDPPDDHYDDFGADWSEPVLAQLPPSPTNAIQLCSRYDVHQQILLPCGQGHISPSAFTLVILYPVTFATSIVYMFTCSLCQKFPGALQACFRGASSLPGDYPFEIPCEHCYSALAFILYRCGRPQSEIDLKQINSLLCSQLTNQNEPTGWSESTLPRNSPHKIWAYVGPNAAPLLFRCMRHLWHCYNCSNAKDACRHFSGIVFPNVLEPAPPAVSRHLSPASDLCKAYVLATSLIHCV
jgi:hypothetical protein